MFFLFESFFAARNSVLPLPYVGYLMTVRLESLTLEKIKLIIHTAVEVLVISYCSFFHIYSAKGSMHFRDTDGSILAVFKYDTCRYLTETLEVPIRTKLHTYRILDFFTKLFYVDFCFFAKSPCCRIILSPGNLNSQQASARTSTTWTTKHASVRNR